MNTTIAQQPSAWTPHANQGHGRPGIPEPAFYGLTLSLCFVIVFLARRIRRP